MIDRDAILGLIKSRMKRILEFGELALPPERYTVFRKLVLDEFGRSGLEADLDGVFRGQYKERNGQAYTAKKGG